MREEINKAVEVLKRGGLILYPTDTVWGIGCDATNDAAVQKIYDLKRSGEKRSMIILACSPDQAARHSDNVPDVAWQLMELTDKPLTLILPGAYGISAKLVPEDNTIGIRVPDHDFCRQLISRLGRPLVSTSANISGEKTPLYFEDIKSEVKDGVDMIIDRRWEGHPTRQPSSLIKLSPDGEVTIIRP